MQSPSSQQHAKTNKQNQPAEPEKRAERDKHEGPPRSLGSQTNLGDQEELDGVRDPSMEEAEKTTQEQREERAHSNTTTDYSSRRTRAGERDPFGAQGQY